MTMEYKTKWSHTHESKVPSLSTYKPSPITGSRQSEQTQTTRYSGVDKKSPYGQLAVKELVSRVKQARMQSPFANDYKKNDPIEATPLNASGSDENGSGISLDSDLDEGMIHTQPSKMYTRLV